MLYLFDASAPITPTGIITATSTLILSISVLCGVLPVLITTLRTTKSTKKIAEDTHIIVNGQRTAMLKREAVLEELLKQAGVTVPARPPEEHL